MSGRAYSLRLLVGLLCGLALTALLVRVQETSDQAAVRRANAEHAVRRAITAEQELTEAQATITTLRAQLEAAEHAAVTQQRQTAEAVRWLREQMANQLRTW